MSVSEVKAKGDFEKIVHMNGTIVAGTKNWDPINLTLFFDLTDGSSTIGVVYRGYHPNAYMSFGNLKKDMFIAALDEVIAQLPKR